MHDTIKPDWTKFPALLGPKLPQAGICHHVYPQLITHNKNRTAREDPTVVVRIEKQRVAEHLEDISLHLRLVKRITAASAAPTLAACFGRDRDLARRVDVDGDGHCCLVAVGAAREGLCRDLDALNTCSFFEGTVLQPLGHMLEIRDVSTILRGCELEVLHR